MRKTPLKVYRARNAKELAEVLGLTAADAVEWEFRVSLINKITTATAESGLTHDQIAKKAKTSRTKVTAVVNRNTMGISTDLLLRILTALGYEARMTFRRISAA